MKKELTQQEVLQKATAYCSKSEHCECEVRQKLFQWGYSQQEIQNNIIDYLYDNNYMNTERYCNAFVSDKLRFQHWGRIKIRSMLQAKKLPRQDIENALKKIDEDMYADILAQTANQKIRLSHLSLDDDKSRNQLYGFLLQRGFESDLILRTFMF